MIISSTYFLYWSWKNELSYYDKDIEYLNVTKEKSEYVTS